jgi:hypothetical protein
LPFGFYLFSTMAPTRATDPRRGYQWELFVDHESASVFKCGVCLCVLNNAKQCKAGHALCGGCFDEVIQTSAKCPSCRLRVIEDDLSTCLLINNLVQKLRVFCKCCVEMEQNRRPGCQWTGTLVEREGRDCEYLYGSCSFEGCNTHGLRMSYMEDHQSRCWKRPVSCVACQELYPRDAKVHHASVCAYRKVECDGCGDKVGLNELADHKAECDMRIVQCMFYKEYGVCVTNCNGMVNKCLALKHIGEQCSKLITVMHGRCLQQKDTIQAVSFFWVYSCCCIITIILRVQGLCAKKKKKSNK